MTLTVQGVQETVGARGFSRHLHCSVCPLNTVIVYNMTGGRSHPQLRVGQSEKKTSLL